MLRTTRCKFVSSVLLVCCRQKCASNSLLTFACIGSACDLHVLASLPCLSVAVLQDTTRGKTWLQVCCQVGAVKKHQWLAVHPLPRPRGSERFTPS